MRIFNATNSVLTLPLTSSQNLVVQPKSVSQEFMGSTTFLSMLITSFTNKQIAIVVSGPYELNVCANIPTAVNYTVQTLDDAIKRFCLNKKEPKKEPEKVCKCEECKKEEAPEPKPEPKVEEQKIEEKPIEEEEKTVESEPEPEPIQEEKNIVSEEVVSEEVVEKKTRKKRSSKK